MRLGATPALLAATAALAWSSLAPAHNYAQADGPRYCGHFAHGGGGRALHLATFNLQFSREIDRATALFEAEPALRQADIVTLQEMDAPGTLRLAQALGYDYVYYPAAYHPTGGKDFGNAVLVRGRILGDHKVRLPYPSRSRGLQRIAVAADVEVSGRRLRVYSVHLETPTEIWPWQRRAQMEAVLADASAARAVVIAGDFNDRDVVGPLMEKSGYGWLSRAARHTVGPFAWDHVFTRGLPAPVSCGVVQDNRQASDHRPVWAELRPRPL